MAEIHNRKTEKNPYLSARLSEFVYLLTSVSGKHSGFTPSDPPMSNEELRSDLSLFTVNILSSYNVLVLLLAIN